MSGSMIRLRMLATAASPVGVFGLGECVLVEREMAVAFVAARAAECLDDAEAAEVAALVAALPPPQGLPVDDEEPVDGERPEPQRAVRPRGQQRGQQRGG